MPILFHRKDLIATTFLCCCYSPGVSLLRRLQFLLTFTPCVCSQFCGFGVLDSLAYSANGHPLTVVLPYHATFNDCCSRTRLGISPSALTQRISPCDFYGIGFQDESLKSVHDFRAFSQFSFPVCAYAHSSRCAPCIVGVSPVSCVPCCVPCGLWRHRRGGLCAAFLCGLCAAFRIRNGGGIIEERRRPVCLCAFSVLWPVLRSVSERRRRPVCLCLWRFAFGGGICAACAFRTAAARTKERRRRSFVSS